MRASLFAILIALGVAAAASAQDATPPAPAPVPSPDAVASELDNSMNAVVFTRVPADNAPHQPTAIPGGPARIKGDEAWRFRADGTTVVYVKGHVDLLRGGSRMEADQVVAWIDEALSKESGRVVMDVYAEGNVMLTEEGLRTTEPRTFFRWASTDLTVDDADGFIEMRDRPFVGDFFVRADQARQFGGIPPVPQVIPPKPKPPSGYIEPFQSSAIEISGQQQEGPIIKSHVEGDWRVTVLTRYPDIIFRDPSKPDGDMEILAENMVVWINERNLKPPINLKTAQLQVYAEGHVVIYQGKRIIECEQLFYNYAKESGLLIGGPGGRACIQTFNEKRNMPFYYRANEFRQVSSDQYMAKNAIITSCDFPQPDWGIYAKKMTLTVGTEPVEGPNGETLDRPVERAEAIDTQLVVAGVPVFYWPAFTRDLKNDQTVLKSLSFQHSSKFGTAVFSKWGLYDLGIYQNDWSQALFLADTYSKRGVGLGLDFTYAQPTYFGGLLVYGIHDKGTDSDGFVPDDPDRGRVKWYHRQELSPEWRLDMEVSKISDRGFLPEYFEQESKEGKEQETYADLRYLKDDRSFSMLGRWRLNDYQTQTESLPSAEFWWLGEPLLGGAVTYIQDTQLADLRRRFDVDQQKIGALPPDYRTWRLVTEHEFQVPLHFGGFNIVPFGNFAYNAYENVVSGSTSEEAFTAGFRAGTQYWKVYDVYSRLLDVNQIKHIVAPTIDVLSTVLATKDPSGNLQFDSRDAYDEGTVIRLGLRQRWQTRRLWRNEAPATVGGWYDVNWMILDLQMDYYTNPDMNDGKHFSPLEADYLWQITDRVAISSEADFQVDGGPKLQTFDLGVVYNRSPKLSIYVGDHYVKDTHSNFVVTNLDYKVDERWSLGAYGQWDVLAHTTNDYRFLVRRTLHCWVMELSYEFDAAQKNKSFNIMFWPLGIPEAKLKFF